MTNIRRLDIESFSQGGSPISDYISFEDFRNRSLYISDEIDSSLADYLITSILWFNREDRGIDPAKRKPIYINISSNGGEVTPGLAIVSAIEASKTPVYTVTLAHAFSMSFIVAVAGHKRFALKNSSFLLHDGSSVVVDSSSKARDFMDFSDRLDKTIIDCVIAHSNISMDEYEGRRRDEWYMTAEEARSFGFIDHIVGVDCELDDVTYSFSD